MRQIMTDMRRDSDENVYLCVCGSQKDEAPTPKAAKMRPQPLKGSTGTALNPTPKPQTLKCIADESWGHNAANHV
jgi:hypothetical protein